jgi:hypothetical protein
MLEEQCISGRSGWFNVECDVMLQSLDSFLINSRVSFTATRHHHIKHNNKLTYTKRNGSNLHPTHPSPSGCRSPQTVEIRINSSMLPLPPHPGVYQPCTRKRPNKDILCGVPSTKGAREPSFPNFQNIYRRNGMLLVGLWGRQSGLLGRRTWGCLWGWRRDSREFVYSVVSHL